MPNHTNMNTTHVTHITYPSPVDCDFCLTAVWTPTDRPVGSKLLITSSSYLLGESLVSRAGQDPQRTTHHLTFRVKRLTDHGEICQFPFKELTQMKKIKSKKQ